MKVNNSIAKLVYNVGVIEIIAGIVLGFIFGSDNTDPTEPVTHWSIVITWTAVGFISGVLFMGLAEIIRLLDSINSKINQTDEMDISVEKKNSRAEIYKSELNNDN